MDTPHLRPSVPPKGPSSTARPPTPTGAPRSRGTTDLTRSFHREQYNSPVSVTPQPSTLRDACLSQFGRRTGRTESPALPFLPLPSRDPNPKFLIALRIAHHYPFLLFPLLLGLAQKGSTSGNHGVGAVLSVVPTPWISIRSSPCLEPRDIPYYISASAHKPHDSSVQKPLLLFSTLCASRICTRRRSSSIFTLHNDPEAPPRLFSPPR